MEFKIRTQEDFDPVLDKLDEWNQPYPNLLMPTFAFTAEEGDKIVGMGLLQTVPLIEPFHVDEEHRMSDVGIRLYRNVHRFVREKHIPRVFMHSERKEMQRLLEKSGCRPTGHVFYELRKDW